MARSSGESRLCRRYWWYRHALGFDRPITERELKGNLAEKALGRAYITCNKNGIPFDKEKFTVTSGIRIGSHQPEQLGVSGLKNSKK